MYIPCQVRIHASRYFWNKSFSPETDAFSSNTFHHFIAGLEHFFTIGKARRYQKGNQSDRHYNDQKKEDKGTNNDLQNTRQKTKN